MNILCFVSFVLMVCWNLHLPGVEIYTFSVNVVLMVCWNLCIPAYGKKWNLHIALLFRWILGWIWTQNVGCHCIVVIKHGLLCFVMLMHGWACIDYGPQLTCGQLDKVWYRWWWFMRGSWCWGFITCYNRRLANGTRQPSGTPLKNTFKLVRNSQNWFSRYIWI